MVAELSDSHWRDDLDHLVDSLRRQHRNLHHTTSSDAFDRAVRMLRGRIPFVEGNRVVVELARLVASIGDGHTVLGLSDIPGFRRYPIVPYQFGDGMHIRAVDREHAAVAGTRLVAVDGTPIEEAVALLRPLVSRDNEMGVLSIVPDLLAIPEVLHATGLAHHPDRATYTVQRADSTEVPLELDAASPMPDSLVDAGDAAAAPTPLWLQRSAAENWQAHLPEHDTLYVALNRISDGEREPLAAFFDRIFETVERERVELLILDIRRNHGGNNMLNRSLIHHLIRCDRVNRWGGLFAITGRITFSAAMNLAVDLERHTRVLFVGEPTGSSPNHFGENGDIHLPHSGLHVSVSTLWWQVSDPYDDRPWIMPDIPAWMRSTDYAAHHDPAVAACLAYRDGDVPQREYPDRVFASLGLADPRSAPDRGGSAAPGS
jgi:hypothetical protein